MQTNRPLILGIVITVIGFVAVAIIAYMGLRQSVTAVVPMQTIPIENITAGNTLYEISPSTSEARFMLNETLRGVDTLVVGTTDQIAGQIAFNPDDLTKAQVGTTTVNAQALATDNNFRNNTLRSDILLAYLYEYIVFEPTAITELTSSISEGESTTFNITGDLTIRDITRPATFVVTAQLVSPTQLKGIATTTLTRSDFELQIPSVPGVANVDNEVMIEIEFVADQVQ